MATPRKKKVRLDVLLVERELVESREKAKRMIMAGQVLVGTDRVTKPGAPVPTDALLDVRERDKYVGRGGHKLEGALEGFGICVEDRLGLDVGASTGGFTDCLLQRGARHVYAIDVGTNQMAWKLRNDLRVTCREHVNARYLELGDFPEAPQIAVMDLSFISLTKILPSVAGVLAPGADVVALIKPQFELEREQVGKGGIVREPELHRAAVDKIRDFIATEGALRWIDVMDSPILGGEGNKEFLAWMRKNG